MAYQAYPSVVKTALGGGSSLAEVYIPLWVHSSSEASSNQTSPGVVFLGKGNTGISDTTHTSSSIKLHVLSSSWNPNQLFALEVSLRSGNSAYNANVALYDITAGSIVSNATVSTNSTTSVLLRSGRLTLVPGHVYGVTIFISSTTYVYCNKAHLVALLK